MESWLISSDTQKWDIESYFEEDGYIDWTRYANYEVGDIIYIYAKVPVAKVMFKTVVVENFEEKSRLKLIGKVDTDALSLKNLRCHGLKNAPMGAKKLNGELEFYIERYFSRFWFVTAGEKSFKINEFRENNFVAIGWNYEDWHGKTKDEIKSLYVQHRQDDSPQEIGQAVSQINLFVNEIQIGDFICSSDKINREFIIGRCTSDYYISDSKDNTENQYKNCRDVEWICNIEQIDVSPDVKVISPKSVYELKDATKEELFKFLDFQSFSSDKKPNVIYFGAPGTGKSYMLNKELKELLKGYENNYERVTFYPDYTYANFVGTYKPVPDTDEDNKPIISYKYVPGPFMRTLVKALRNPSEPYVLIIEEINRANVAAVFGDVFQLLDRDNCYESEYPINLSEDMHDYIKEELDYSKLPKYLKCVHRNYLKDLLGEDYEKIKIPSNMFIWATMNSADQGVFTMDTAFKRRWEFKYLGINDGAKHIENLKFELYGEKFLWNDVRTAINNSLLSYGINEDKLMGPFFAFTEFIEDNFIPEDEFKYIFKNKIIMYLFEDAARSRRDNLFSGIENNVNIIYSDICSKFDDEKKGLKIFNDSIINKIFHKDSD